MTFNMHVHMQMHVWRKVKTGTVTREAPVPPPLHPVVTACRRDCRDRREGNSGRAAHHGGGQ